MSEDDHILMLSALQHFAFCPRQFALIHNEQVWSDNWFTAQGNLLHERVDSGEMEQRGTVRSERSVMLESQKYHLRGKMDLLEIHQGQPAVYFPVEYKRGKPKVEDWDRIQLCAQALCLEEMRDIEVLQGAIWYWEVRQRKQVDFDAGLRKKTIETIKAAFTLKQSGNTPKPIVDKKRCQACSLYDLCEPKAFRKDKSTAYIDELFRS